MCGMSSVTTKYLVQKLFRYSEFVLLTGLGFFEVGQHADERAYNTEAKQKTSLV
jgi:hypothetical protein